MMENTLSVAAQSMHGELRGADRNFRGVSTDTRTIRSGELYFALRGPNFDGSDFVDSAAERRAAAAVVSAPVDVELSQITVGDTRLALGELAASWRRRMPATVVGVTGSNGKTTAKEMIAACLSLQGETLATSGNLNNDIGMPLMLSRLGPEHRFAVIEMGANHAGEIAYLAGLAQAEIAVVTNAGPAHLEGFGSLDGVARAKGEILQTQPRPKVAVLNADDRFFPYWQSLVTDVETVSFGMSGDATVRASDVHTGHAGCRFQLHCGGQHLRIDLRLPGEHNVLNACAAAAVAISLKLPLAQVKRGLESVLPVSGRLAPLETRQGAVLYDDSYNANPESVIAACRFLAAQPGDTLLVLGDMGELGDDAPALHRSVGEAASAAGLERLMATGELSQHTVDGFGSGGTWFASVDELTEALADQVHRNSVVLVKGSRAARMERVVEALAGPPRRER